MGMELRIVAIEDNTILLLSKYLLCVIAHTAAAATSYSCSSSTLSYVGQKSNSEQVLFHVNGSENHK